MGKGTKGGGAASERRKGELERDALDSLLPEDVREAMNVADGSGKKLTLTKVTQAARALIKSSDKERIRKGLKAAKAVHNRFVAREAALRDALGNPPTNASERAKKRVLQGRLDRVQSQRQAAENRLRVYEKANKLK